MWPCHTPANKIASEATCHHGVALPEVRSWLLQGLLEHGHRFEHSATLMLTTASRVTPRLSVAKRYPLLHTASSHFAAGSVPPRQEGDHGSQPGSMLTRHPAQVYGSLSPLDGTTSLHIWPGLKHGKSLHGEKHHLQSKPSMAPERSQGGKEEKTPPFR